MPRAAGALSRGLFGASGCFRPIFSPERCFPGNRRPRCRQRRPAHGRIIGRIAPVPVGCARFFLTGARPRVPSSRLPQSAHSGALELRCSGFRPGSAASRRIFLPRTLPRLPSRRVPFSLPAAPGVAGLPRAASNCLPATSLDSHSECLSPHGRAARESPPVPPTAALVMPAP